MVKVALFGQHQQLITEVPEATETLVTFDGIEWVRDGTYYPPGARTAGPDGPMPSRNLPIPQYRPRYL